MVEKMQVEQALQGIDQVLKEVRAEREKQIKKVGTQDHDPHWWLAILAEETGEVAKEITEARLGNWDAGKYREESRLQPLQSPQSKCWTMAWLEICSKSRYTMYHDQHRELPFHR